MHNKSRAAGAARITSLALLTSLSALLLGSCGPNGNPGANELKDPDDPPAAGAPAPNPGATPASAAPYPGVRPTGEVTGELNFATLLRHFRKGQAKNTPWAGYWFPYADEGIASAAQKLDRARGSGRSVDWELANHGPRVPGLQDWWGHCNGWAAASALFQEPKAPKSVGEVSFSVADQKAILSELSMEIDGVFFGNRNESDNPSDPTFKDVYPNQFFVVLTNILGNGKPLLIDRYTGSQVWNQPLAGYEIEPIKPDDYLGADPQNPNVHRVEVTTQVWWARDDVQPGHQTEPFAFKDSDSFESRIYRYEVWLDAPPKFNSAGELESSGKVILNRPARGLVTGGVWRMGNTNPANSYPDYMWYPKDLAPSSGFANPFVDRGWVEQNLGVRNANP